MGINKRTIIECTCDLCGVACGINEGHFTIDTATGVGDVGPANISGNVYINIPYGCSGGLLCKTCQKKWLQRYINSI